jgi:NADPH:quinone reductase-like Zn-dependent oxidoreductase
VTGVCSTGNVELVRSIGADHVVDYTMEDFTRTGRRYDLMLDIARNRSWSACKRVLHSQATLVVVGGPKTNRWIGPLGNWARLKLAAVLGTQEAVFFVAKLNKPDLTLLGELIETGKVTPVIDRRYSLSEAGEALRYVAEGHARGKVVITV